MTYKSRRSASHLNGRATGVVRWKYFVKRENRVLRGIATEKPSVVERAVINRSTPSF
jgi:hypothetical protein